MNMIGATSPAPRLIGENAPREHAAERLGKNDAGDRLELRRPERQARVAELARHGAQGFFGRDDHHRQSQDGERERRPDERGRAVDELPS